MFFYLLPVLLLLCGFSHARIDDYYGSYGGYYPSYYASNPYASYGYYPSSYSYPYNYGSSYPSYKSSSSLSSLSGPSLELYGVRKSGQSDKVGGNMGYNYGCLFGC